MPPRAHLVRAPPELAGRRVEALERDQGCVDGDGPLGIHSGPPGGGRPGGEDPPALAGAALPALVVRRPQLRVLPPTLAEDPDDVAPVLEEAAVEVDEGPQLPGRVAGSFLQLRDGLLDVGALLGGVDQRARQPRLAAVDAVDGGLGDAGPLRDGADAGAGPALLQEAGAGRRGDQLSGALGLLLAQLGPVGAGGAHEEPLYRLAEWGYIH